MVAGALAAQIGVEAVVEGVSEFKRNILDMAASITGFGDKVGILGKIFNAIISPIGAFLGFLRDIAVVAGGVLLRDGILFLVNGLKEIISETIQSGIEFQKLKVRLDTLIARQLIAADTSLKFGDALAQASIMASDLFVEITKLALTSPFDIADVANVFSLATSYGFLADAALEVTQAVIDFTAGMGLSNIEAERIIVNLGQMIQLGKVTQREMTDLARGAFVPVNDVLEIMADNLGITTEALAKLRKDGLLPASTFIEAFIQLVGEEFPNAAQRASRTLEGVTGNIKDLIQGVLGFNVVRPILDALAAPLADIIDALSADPRLIETAQRIGEILSDMVTNLLGFLPTAESLADILVTKFGILADILAGIAAGNFDVVLISLLNLLGLSGDQLVDTFLRVKGIIASFQEGGILGGLAATGLVPQPILDFIEDIQTAIGNFKQFLEENGPEIGELFGEIFGALGGEAADVGGGILGFIGQLIVNLSEALVENGPNIVSVLEKIKDFIVDDFLPALNDLGDWVADNSDLLLSVFGSAALATVIVGILLLNAAFVVLLLVFAPVILIILALIATFAILVAVVFGVIQAFLAFKGLPGVFTKIWENIKSTAINIWEAIKTNTIKTWEDTKAKAIEIWGTIKTFLSTIWEAIKINTITSWENTKAKAIEIWGNIKLAIINVLVSLVVEIAKKWVEITTTIKQKLQEILTTIVSFATQWAQAGKNLVSSLAQGIRDSFDIVIRAAEALARAAMAAFNAIFKPGSPSKVMIEMGENLSRGLAIGISNLSNLPAMAARATATQTVAAVAAAAPVVGGATTQNFNNTLNIATSAPSEPIISDFELLTTLNA